MPGPKKSLTAGGRVSALSSHHFWHTPGKLAPHMPASWGRSEPILLSQAQQCPTELRHHQNLMARQSATMFLNLDHFQWDTERWSYSSKFIQSLPAKSLQSCPTLCDPRDRSPPGSPIPRILQARTLEWVAISFSNAWKWKVKGKSLSHVRLLATSWTAAYQAPPSMGFSRQEYWSGLSLPSPIQSSKRQS